MKGWPQENAWILVDAEISQNGVRMFSFMANSYRYNHPEGHEKRQTIASEKKHGARDSVIDIASI